VPRPDLGRYNSPSPAPRIGPPGIFSWSGCYLGISGGFARLRETSVPISGDAATLASQALGNVPLSLDPKPDSGGLVGAQTGCNLQMNNFVFGVEGDLSFMDS